MRTQDVEFETLRLTQSGRVLTVSYYSNPPHNLVTTQFLRDLDRLTRSVDRDRSVGAVVLASDVDRRFMIHVDAEDLLAAIDLPGPTLSRSLVLPFWTLAYRALGLPGAEALIGRFGGVGAGLLWGFRWKRSTLRMNRSRVVYLAAIGGAALAGGNEIAMACDIRYAADSEHVVFGQSEILFGMLPGGGGTQRLPRLVGTGRALEMILEGGNIDAQTALDYGLVHRLVPEEELLSETQRAAQRLARRSGRAVAMAKRLVYGTTDQPLSRGADRELASFIAAGTSRLPKRALSALVGDLEARGDTPFLAASGPWRDGTRIGPDDRD